MRLKKKASAMVLPMLLLLATVLMVITSALIMSSTSSMRVTTFDQQSDVAMYAAETGLSRAAEEYMRTGEIQDSKRGTLAGTGASYVVLVTLNDTDEPKPVEGGPNIPPSTLYLLAEGTSANKITRRAGALFRVGLGAFQVGVISDTLRAKSSRFDAYDSATNPDPSLAQQPNRGILASNRVDPAIVEKQFQFLDSVVEGGVYAAPATTPGAQIGKAGATVLARESTLAEPITIEAVEVPEMPRGEASGGESVGGEAEGENGEFDFETYSPPEWQMVNGAPLELTISYNPSSQEFLFKDIRETQLVVALPASMFNSHVESGTPLSFDLPESRVYLNFQNNPPTIGYHDRSVFTGFQAESEIQFPAILADAMGAATPSVRNPDELGEGDYGSVTIDDPTPTVLDSGIYVMKSLEITGEGRLALPPGKKATIYVTERLSAAGPNALVNDTKLPPNLKIFYTGKDAVMLAGGSQSYFTLVAPQAAVHLVGANATSPTSFFGALVGKTVDVENAIFHYDVATEGVGTGTDGSTLSLLSRQRL